MAHDTFFLGGVAFAGIQMAHGAVLLTRFGVVFPFFLGGGGWGGLRYSLSECAALFWWISPLLLRPFGLDLPVFQPPQSSVADGENACFRWMLKPFLSWALSFLGSLIEAKKVGFVWDFLGIQVR